MFGMSEKIKIICLYSKYPENKGRIMHPEDAGEVWALDKNMAFWTGGIEAGKKFLLVSPIQEIKEKAEFAVNAPNGVVKKLSVVLSELMWLEDNGYVFTAHEVNKKFLWAIPPSERVTDARITEYPTASNDTYARPLLERVRAICRKMNEKQREQTVRHAQLSFTYFAPTIKKTDADGATASVINRFSILDIL
jgi:hypothetical protein